MQGRNIAAVEFLAAGPGEPLIEQGKAHFLRLSGRLIDGFEVWDGVRRVYVPPPEAIHQMIRP